MNEHADLAPSPWIARFAPLLPAGGCILDVAAGRGRHARFLARRGLRVLAVDRDAEALSTLHGEAGVETRVADLEGGEWPFGDRRFDGIVVTDYLHRPLGPVLAAALAPAGTLLYETFAAGNERFGRPSNPAFLLAPGELLRTFGELTVVAFEQGQVGTGERRAVVQRLAAVGPAREWPPGLPAPDPAAGERTGIERRIG